LDDVLDRAAALGAHGPAQRADDTGGDCRLEAKGVADGDHELAHLEPAGVAEPGVGETGP